jgi:hypothetical protein
METRQWLQFLRSPHDRAYRRLERGAREGGGRTETDRVLGEAHKLFEEVGDMLTEMRRQLPGSGRQ